MAQTGSSIFKMRGYKGYITLTDESQNATLTQEAVDRLWDAENA